MAYIVDNVEDTINQIRGKSWFNNSSNVDDYVLNLFGNPDPPEEHIKQRFWNQFSLRFSTKFARYVMRIYAAKIPRTKVHPKISTNSNLQMCLEDSQKMDLRFQFEIYGGNPNT
jgi:hypothetical protein